MIVYVDMDGVLTDFYYGFLSAAHRLGYKTKQSYSWDLEDHLSIDVPYSERKNIVHTIMNNDSFWLELKPIQGAVEGLKKLNSTSKVEVYILTAPYFSNLDCIKSKLIWIKQNLKYFNLENVIFALNKPLLRGDVLIDDRPKYINNWQGKVVFCFQQPWNVRANLQNIHCPIHEIQHWDQIPYLINDLLLEDYYTNVKLL